MDKNFLNVPGIVIFSCSSRQTVLNLKSETEIRNRNEKGRAEERVTSI